jgi:enoyl-CoA hydratase/carnithine racemase
MSGPYTNLLLDHPCPGIGCITLNRPARANALNTALAEELADAVTCAASDAACRCLIVTGAGERAFCAGADLKDRQGMDPAAWEVQHRALRAGAAALADCPLPVIAAVNGAAFGGGCELVLACDFAFAADHATFALPEVTLGIMPGLGATQRLPRVAGLPIAKQYLLTGRTFTAAQALVWGVVNEVHPPAALLPRAIAVAGEIAANAPLSVRYIKQAANATLETGLAEGMRIELDRNQALVDTEDRCEGIAAFNAKRRPEFKGR